MNSVSLKNNLIIIGLLYCTIVSAAEPVRVRTDWGMRRIFERHEAGFKVLSRIGEAARGLHARSFEIGVDIIGQYVRIGEDQWQPRYGRINKTRKTTTTVLFEQYEMTAEDYEYCLALLKAVGHDHVKIEPETDSVSIGIYVNQPGRAAMFPGWVRSFNYNTSMDPEEYKRGKKINDTTITHLKGHWYLSKRRVKASFIAH